MQKRIYSESQDLSVGKTVNSTISNPITSDSSILSYYTGNKYNEIEIFDKSYATALQLSCGDRLLKPAAAINSVTIRRTSTPELYKLIFTSHDANIKIEYIDEGKLLNNRKYCSATISRISSDEYEITCFEGDEISIEHYSKEEVVDFMNKNKLIFQN